MSLDGLSNTASVVLELPSVESRQTAVRASILADVKANKGGNKTSSTDTFQDAYAKPAEIRHILEETRECSASHCYLSGWTACWVPPHSGNYPLASTTCFGCLTLFSMSI